MSTFQTQCKGFRQQMVMVVKGWLQGKGLGYQQVWLEKSLWSSIGKPIAWVLDNFCCSWLLSSQNCDAYCISNWFFPLGYMSLLVGLRWWLLCFCCLFEVQTFITSSLFLQFSIMHCPLPHLSCCWVLVWTSVLDNWPLVVFFTIPEHDASTCHCGGNL